MVAVYSSQKVLVTGGSGYIGAWVVKYLIDAGYPVVAAVRTPAAANFLKAQHAGKGLTTVLVPDIEVEGAYDEAIKGAEGVIHLASPFHFSWTDPQEIIGPAVNGALSILKAASKTPSVKRVVITSSALAANFLSLTPGFVPEKTPLVYTEADWDTVSPDVVLKDGAKAHPFAVYTASKTLAEQAAWAYVKKNKPSYDLSTVLPVYAFGPWLHDVPTKEKAASSIGVLLGSLANPDTSGTRAGGHVDTRDAALLHVLALSTPAAGGERILATAAEFAWQDVYDILNKKSYSTVPKGIPGAGKAIADVRFDNSKSLKLFPTFKYRSFETELFDLAAQAQKAGFFS